MNVKLLLEIIKKEIRDIIRDKKTLMMMIVVPLILYPVLIGAMMIIQDKMVSSDTSQFATIGFTFEPDSDLTAIIKELEIESIIGTEKELKEKYEQEEINAYITLEDNNFKAYYSAKNTSGQITLTIIENLVESYKVVKQAKILDKNKIDIDSFYNNYTLEEIETTGTSFMISLFMSMIPSLLLIALSLTASLAAIDMTAGEKERGTLETLLTFPIKKEIIIAGKFISTTICTAVSAVIGFLSMYGVLYFLSRKLESFENMTLLTTPNFIAALIVFIVFSMLMSIISIALSCNAKSFKEAQNITQPLSIFGMVPMFASMLNIKLNTTLAMIPFINVGLLISDILANAVDIKLLLITIISTIVIIAILVKVVGALFKSDKILFQ